MNYRNYLSKERVMINPDHYFFHEVNHKTRHFRFVFTLFIQIYVFLNHFNHSHGRRFTVIATTLQCLAILGNILFSVHALLTASYYLKVSANYYSWQQHAPKQTSRARMEGVLFPNLVRSVFMQWSRLFQWIRAMSVLEFNGGKCRILSADCTWCRPNSLLANEERR
jgi:hypothetical protein